MSKKYVIGIDFGSESARAVLMNVADGAEIAQAVYEYPHGVIEITLPETKQKLKKDWYLQVADDYLWVLEKNISAVIKEALIAPQEIIGIGIDFTASTVLPLDSCLKPLSQCEELKGNPHSYVKLWKHHGAQPYADEITEKAKATNQSFLKNYGGKISSEWLFPKLLQILREDPQLYEKIDLFMEAGDWLVSILVGKIVRSTNTTGYKAMWSMESGYPSKDFLEAVDPRLSSVLNTKLRGEILSVGSSAGRLTEAFAERLGLPEGLSVAVNIIDAHAAVPAVGAVTPGDLVMSMGTSTCQMLISDEQKTIPGICGIVKNGIVPNYYSYETGQVAVGDSFAWFVDNFVNSRLVKKAIENEQNLYEFLESKAWKRYQLGNNILALDWWNGNRTDLVDSELSGIFVGMTLKTRPEDLYLALLESTAFGARLIVENYAKESIEVKRIFACGGLPQKSPLLMQIYADVLNKEIYIADSKEITAVGAGIYGAVAAGYYSTLEEAARKLAKVKTTTIKPNEKHVKHYHSLYAQYKELHNIFGIANKKIMHTLAKANNL